MLIAGGAGEFPLLPVAVGEDFDLGAERGLVVGQAGEIETHGMVLVSALVAEQHRRRIELGDDQIGGALAFHVGGDQAARRRERDLVEAQRWR